MSDEAIAFEQVQANILLPYQRANCARMMYFRFDATRLAEARAWVSALSAMVTYHADVRDTDGDSRESGDGPWVNVGFTHEGLQALGFDPFTLKYLPDEFQLGMHARADRLGDVLPHDGYQERVHAVVTVHVYDEHVRSHARAVGNAAHEWRELSADAIKDLEYAVYQAMEKPTALLPRSPAVEHLAEHDQDTYRLDTDQLEGIEYFGFRDGISQPRIQGAVEKGETPDCPPGAVLLGFKPPKIRDDAPDPPGEETRAEVAARHLEHGSMLVVRKLRQDVEGFRTQAERHAARIDDLGGRQLAELMMGRRMDGGIMATPAPEPGQDMDFRADPEGRGCPFQSHVRRANPRNAESRIRRVMRRAMPYSRLRQKQADKGVMFCVYNANIEAQFEFVQRLWINSGVENFGLSRDRDPIAGEPPRPETGEVGKASFSFTSPVDERPHTLTGLQSHVSFEWGDYFLAPSRDTLREIGASPDSPIAELEARMAKETSLLLRRDVLGRWLDDPDVGPRIWREVRARGGVVRFDDEGVVLAGSEAAVAEVLRDDGTRYSVEGQGESMRQTTGAFYLGMDAATTEYVRDSAVSSKIIPGWSEAHELYQAAKEGQQGALTDERRRVLTEQQKAELDQVRLATMELCMTFFGLSVTEAVAEHDKPGLPARAELDVAKYTAFVLSGLTPTIFGVPQPSAAGTFTMNIPHSGYIFFPFPEESFLEYADQAAQGISAYYGSLFEQRARRNEASEFPKGAESLRPEAGDAPEATDDRWKKKLNDTLTALEQVYRDSRIAHAQDRHWTKQDSIRTMAGVISGMLIASFKLFIDGVSNYARRFPVDAPIAKQPGRMARVPFTTQKERETSMPNILYRIAKGPLELAGQKVQQGDYVLTCQGSAMADSGREWFYGDRTPEGDEVPQAPHFCPGYLMADAMLETMSTLLFDTLPDLRRTDGTGRMLSYSFGPVAETIHQLKELQKQREGEAAKP